MKTQKRWQPGNENGMSLIELMIALVLLMIGLLSIGSLQLSAVQGNGNANRKSQAIMLASDRIEKLINADTTAADLGEGTHQDPNNPREGFCNISWTVTRQGDGSRYISVNAQWRDMHGNTKNRELEYIRGD